MLIAEVIGTVVSPVQHPILEGQRLLLLRPLSPWGEPSGPTRIGIDCVSACTGDRVLVVDEGNAGRQLMQAKDGPVKTLVVGVIDTIECSGQLSFSAHQRSGSASQ